MGTSDYLAVAALLLGLAVSWKALMEGRNGNKSAKAHDVAKLIEQIDHLQREIDALKDLFKVVDKLATKVEYQISTRLEYVEREVFRQEMLDELKEKFPKKDI